MFCSRGMDVSVHENSVEPCRKYAVGAGDFLSLRFDPPSLGIAVHLCWGSHIIFMLN